MGRYTTIDRFIYRITKKPEYYVEVKNPPKTMLGKLFRPQAARQTQYNRWSRRYKVYSGSYLPENDKRLLRKGWKIKKQLKNSSLIFQRKSTNQTIRSDRHGVPHHYHWLDFWDKDFTNAKYRNLKTKEFGCEKVYYDKYGILTTRIDPGHHLYGDKKDD